MNREFLDVPGKKAAFDANTQSEEEIRLGSRVSFANQAASSGSQVEDLEGSLYVEEPPENREEWDNKTQFYMGVISYAVGLGNVWRFPYLCQKNGGGAFLIPYVVMMAVGGLPLFLIELGIGQRLRTGPIGVWNAIHPYLGGVGVSAAIVSYLVALYYNVIITWCLYYLGQSFSLELPWAHCPTNENGTIEEECALSSSPTMFFWNRKALDTSESIGNLEGLNPRITISLLCAWTLVYFCVMKGIKSSGKVMYATATFPYLVTTIFLIRSLTLDGAMEGLWYMINPDLEMLYSPDVWLEAATQIFYSMGLGFGGLIAFGSMFGTLEGVITSLNDSRLITVKKPILTAVLCASACAIGLLFSTKAGQYWVALFDHFAGSYALMCVAFCEVIAVVYIYGFRRFSRDIEYMTGSPPSNYYIYTWRFISPLVMFILFSTSIIQCFSHLPRYFAYEKATAKQIETEYPIWALFIAFGMVVMAIAPVPLVWFLRKFKIWKADDVPVAQKCLGATASTTYMLKSEPSFNRMTESAVSMNEIEGQQR
ncbi:unnamed protein product, partial [Mesorhabditis belari]|uniref:Transporter n=1 Tax=Mesorhabditis belari TaxID=2138241 RepID=A0AAF3EGX9_9BILA